MEDYYSKYGFTPQQMGLASVLNDDIITASAQAVKPVSGNVNKQQQCASDSSNSKFSDVPLNGLPLTMAFVALQPLEDVYDEDTGLKNGTIFKNLDKPFLGRKI